MQNTIPGTLDTIATNIFHIMLDRGQTCRYIILDLDKLKDMYVMWQQGKTVNEYTSENNIPDDDSKEEKTEKN
jgi:hypothetical protein